MITCSMPLIQATSVPRWGLSQVWAKSLILMRRGSTTMSVLPFRCTARLTTLAMTG